METQKCSELSTVTTVLNKNNILLAVRTLLFIAVNLSYLETVTTWRPFLAILFLQTRLRENLHMYGLSLL